MHEGVDTGLGLPGSDHLVDESDAEGAFGIDELSCEEKVLGGGLVIAYDSANGVAAAFDIADLTMRWRIELATAQHLVLYADTGELVADDHDPELGDSLVVIDVATGTVRARVVVDSPAQSVVFGAPGTRRDFYFVSLSTIARVTFHDT